METLHKISRILSSIGIMIATVACNTGTGSAAKTHVVEIRSMKFQPAQLKVNEGDSVLFINKDIVIHDVTEQSNKRWKSAPLNTGDNYKIIVMQSADYYCSIHPIMKGKIRINKTQ